MVPPKQILLALDLTASDKPLVEQGLAYAKAFHSKIWIIHVAAPESGEKQDTPQYIRDSRAEELRKEHKQIQEYMVEMESDGVECEGLLIQGQAVEMIENEVDQLKADLLIMGEKKHGMMYKALMGNTAAKLLKSISIPVLLVPITKP